MSNEEPKTVVPKPEEHKGEDSGDDEDEDIEK